MILFLRIISLFSILSFYAWTTTAGSYIFNLQSDYGGYYNQLSDSLLAGKTYLSLGPDIPDPDISLYKDRFYLYFGITPVATFFAPYYLLTKKHASENFSIFIFSSGALIFTILLLYYLRKKYFQESPEWMIILCICVTAFCNVTPWLMRRPTIYEAVIACGLFFMTGAVFFLVLAVNKIYPRNIPFLLTGSIFLGLAFGARPTYLFASVILISTMVIKIIKEKDLNVRHSKIYEYVALTVPIAVCIFLLMSYNYLRFDNPFEFGIKYQRSGDNSIPKEFNIKFFIANLYFYFFGSQKIDSYFPFIHLNDVPIYPSWLTPPSFHSLGGGGVIGLLTGIPFVLIVVIAPFLYYKTLKQNKPNLLVKSILLPYPEFRIIFLVGCIMLITISFWTAIYARFIADFATFLILSSCISWLHFDSLLKDNSNKKNLRNIAIILAFISIVFGLAYSLKGDTHTHGGLEEQNYEQFKKLEIFFKPISNFIERITSK